MSAIGTFRFYEVFKYWTDMGTTMSTYSVVMNQNKWNAMPKDIQDAIMKVSGKMGAEYAGTKAYGFDLQQEVFDAMKKGNYSMEKVAYLLQKLRDGRRTAGSLSGIAGLRI